MFAFQSSNIFSHSGHKFNLKMTPKVPTPVVQLDQPKMSKDFHTFCLALHILYSHSIWSRPTRSLILEFNLECRTLTFGEQSEIN